jgi:hypothetical protein
MTNDQTPPDLKVPEPWQPRYGVGSLLLVMLVFCVMAAAGYYLVRALRGERAFQVLFILFTVTAPLVLVVVISSLRALWLSLRNR